MSSYKEESNLWIPVRTSSFLDTSRREGESVLSTNSGTTPRKESIRTSNDSTRLSAMSSRTKSVDINLGSTPPSRGIEERKPNGSSTERIIRRDQQPKNSGSLLKTNSASGIATTNYNYPVVNVNRVTDDSTSSSSSSSSSSSFSSLSSTPLRASMPPPTADSMPNGDDVAKAQKREHLRTQRDNLNWDLQALLVNSNTTTTTTSSIQERKETAMKTQLASKGTDVEGLMTKVWDKQYKEAELYVSISGAELQTSRSLTATEVTIKMNGKILATYPYGEEQCLEIEDKPTGDLSLQIHTTNRLNQRKKMGKCNITMSKLEDGKALETWYSFSKKKRKGSSKSKGYLKVKVMWLSAVTRNKDFLMAKENYTAITSLLFDKEGVIVSTLCKLYKEEDLAMALIRLFNSQKQSTYLLMNLMIREIYFSDDPSTLFRRDSMATKAARIFFSLIAKNYLKRMILSFVAYVTTEVGKGNSYEVDPTKLKSTDEITPNAARLIVAAKKFLSPILDSSNSLPLSVRLFFCNLSSVLRVRVKTGNPVGALFFLRFLFPAVLFPSQYDLMDKPLDPSVFRAMVLVTKILQNLVNGCVFHEDYMTIFNSFITDNIASINAFFETLCTLPAPPNITYDDELTPYTEEQLVKLLSIIVRKLHMFFDKLQPQLQCDPLFLTARDKENQLYLYAKLKTLFLERILTSETGDEAEMKQT